MLEVFIKFFRKAIVGHAHQLVLEPTQKQYEQ